MATPAQFAFLEHDGFLAFAHRGGAAQWPENTMPAFEGAIELGYRYIETDVHATADGVLLAFHDDRLDRVTNKEGVIAELTYSEIKDARIAEREPIPLFEEILAAWPHVRINVDPKADNAIMPLADAIAAHDAIERVCIGSFSDRRLTAMRDILGPRLCTSLGPKATTRLRFASKSGKAAFMFGGFEAGCAQLPLQAYGVRLIDRPLIDFAHEKGLQVHVWTIDDEAEMNRLIDLGVDGLMTDEPEQLKNVLVSRGLWS